MPVSSLRNYTEVLENVGPGTPVFLTKNGHGKYAVLDIEDYNRLAAENQLFAELDAGRASGEENAWITSQNVRAHFEARANHAL